MKYDNKIAPILKYAQKVVISPSNIYTIDNPDVLLIANGNLFGLFIPTESEIQKVDLLVRRIMVSRLAYVENMKTLLLSENEHFLHENFSLLNRICHRILDNNANEYRLIFERDRFESNIPNIGAKIRAKQARLYARNLRIYELGQEEKQAFASFSIDKRFTDGAVVESWSHSQVCVKEAYIIDDFHRCRRIDKICRPHLHGSCTGKNKFQCITSVHDSPQSNHRNPHSLGRLPYHADCNGTNARP